MSSERDGEVFPLRGQASPYPIEAKGGCPHSRINLRHFSRPSCTPRARREASPKGYRFAYAKAYRSAYPLGRSQVGETPTGREWGKLHLIFDLEQNNY